jgi:hypothetical protein
MLGDRLVLIGRILPGKWGIFGKQPGKKTKILTGITGWIG